MPVIVHSLPPAPSPSPATRGRGQGANLIHESILGRTVEGRPIPIYRLSDDATENPKEPAILLVGGVHSREQQPTLCLRWLMDELVRGYGKDPRATHLLKTRQIWIVPVLNVDGKTYDEAGQTGPYGKDWRKNRRPNPGGSSGVDLNRNFPVRWGGYREKDALWNDRTDRAGANIYEGPSPLSEPESRALANFLAAHAARLNLFVDVHSPLRRIFCPNYQWGADADRYQTLLDGVRARQTDHPYTTTEIKRDTDPKPGPRTGNTGLTYTYADYVEGVYGMSIEIGLYGETGDEPAQGDLAPRHYPPVESIRAEYRANLREPLLYLLDACATLPTRKRGNVTLTGSATDTAPVPGATVAWTPTLSGTATWAVLTSESPAVVVQSELRGLPVQTGFTLQISPDAEPGTVVPLTLTVWDNERRLSRCRVMLTLAAGDTIRTEDTKQ